MKKIAVVIPCYNDSNSVKYMHDRLKKVFSEQLKDYAYEIIYVDDKSYDSTWNEIESVCITDSNTKGVCNLRNFGYYRNVYAAMRYGIDSDATFLLFGDLQDPPEMLVEFVKHWEAGFKVVLGKRTNSYSNFLTRILRSFFYRIMAALTKNSHLAGVNGYGLYDKSVVEILAQVDDIQPFLPGIVSEYVRDIKTVPVIQEKSKRETSNFSFWGRYDGAMISITAYTKIFLRIATFVGVTVGFFSLIFALIVVIQKLLFWDTFDAGTPSIIAGIFFLGAVQLFFLGILGEYVLSINNRSMKRPLVVVDKKINFEEGEENDC